MASGLQEHDGGCVQDQFLRVSLRREFAPQQDKDERNGLRRSRGGGKEPHPAGVALPKREAETAEWQAAIEVLMLVSRSGPTMMARIGVMKALNRHVVRVFNPERKDTHWGKRKLKRDQ